ncbi:hypothetical protein SBOR_5779 [Sclerotinia borealis F-4128]|uniref:Uncharacterized protein n=1 Tax=Sclerotinia borealis (strain F-4128) TaxID=1432307 RepID=W9CDD2_SCLBF|nr:hypothetical protein SBOR_5779 [Sclerotinia borealis F-4128]
MVHLHQVQGKLYNFKHKSELTELNMTIDPNVTDIVRKHMVICLELVHGRKDYVKVMTVRPFHYLAIESTQLNQKPDNISLKDDHEYIPISPVPKKPYPIQLRIRNNLGWVYSRGQAVLRLTTLPKFSFLKIDEYYEVSIHMLREANDDYGNPLSIPTKHHGGLAQLKDHVRRRDYIRENARARRVGEEQEGLLQTVHAIDNLALSSEVHNHG